MNEDIYKQVIGQYAEENANLRIALAHLQVQIKELKAEVSECSKNSEPNE